MKYTALVAWVFATLLLLAACAGPADGQNVPAASGDQPQGETPPPEEDAGGEAEFPVYYGDWTVAGEQAASRISALSQEEAEALIGSTVTYAADAFRAPGEETVENPVYSEAVTTAEALSEEYQVNAAELGLGEGEVQTLSVDGAFGLGSFALVKDADTMILYLDGVWFTAVRAA